VENRAIGGKTEIIWEACDTRGVFTVCMGVCNELKVVSALVLADGRREGGFLKLERLFS
jgi:hypothetical protein